MVPEQKDEGEKKKKGDLQENTTGNTVKEHLKATTNSEFPFQAIE